MDSLTRFWDLIVQVWNTGVLGVSLGRALAALFIILFFLLLRRLFSRIVSRWLRVLASRSKTKVDDAIIDALEPPIALVFVDFGLFFAAEFMHVTGILAEVADNVIKSLVIVAIFWCFYRLTRSTRATRR